MKSVAKLYLSFFALAGIATVQSSIISPIATGPANGSAYQHPVPAFDAPPVTEPVAGTTTDDMGNMPGFFTNSGRAVYIDFGPDYATLRISRVYVGLKIFGTMPNSVNATYFWSNDKDKTFEASEGDVLAPSFNYTAIP